MTLYIRMYRDFEYLLFLYVYVCFTVSVFLCIYPKLTIISTKHKKKSFIKNVSLFNNFVCMECVIFKSFVIFLTLCC